MPGKAIAGIRAIIIEHQGITGLLGDHRSHRNRLGALIPFDDLFARKTSERESNGVDEEAVGSIGQILQSKVHRADGRLQNIDLIDHLR